MTTEKFRYKKSLRSGEESVEMTKSTKRRLIHKRSRIDLKNSDKRDTVGQWERGLSDIEEGSSCRSHHSPADGNSAQSRYHMAPMNLSKIEGAAKGREGFEGKKVSPRQKSKLNLRLSAQQIR